MPLGAKPLGASIQKLPILTTALLLLACGALSGCHNRAYNDLYVENMAAEIRDLEDQLYEYDHEYRTLEQELAALRSDNEKLRFSSPATQDSSNSSRSNYPPSSSALPLDFQPRAATPVKPEPAMRPEELPAQPQSILEDPERSAPTNGTQSAAPGQAPGGFRAPSEDELPLPKTDLKGFELNPDDLLPPMIEQGEPMPPPPRSARSDATDGGSLSPDNDLELNLSRIDIPAQLASNRIASDVNAGGSLPTSQQVTDRRVVELAFHPSLSRAANFDDEADDDGLYLVLQPLNESGQMVPIAADLNIVVLDLAREGDEARIGRWDYSAVDVKSKLRPSGSDQGIHLTLPWNGPDPKADRVLVFARYTFPDGRQVVVDKTFFLSREDGLKTVWTPKGNSSTASVSQASYTAPAPLSSQPSKVVRPAVGSAFTQPAPHPDSRPSFAK